jgi:hypothetical protein
MTCTGQFWEFFRPLAESVPGVTTVKRSGGDKMDRLLAASRAEDIYPAIFLLRPKYSIENNGADNSVAWFDATYYVICSGQMDEDEAEDLAFDQAEQMATELSVNIREQADDYLVLIDPAAKIFMEPISLITSEATFGYEVRFRIGLMVNSTIYETL